ncbi:MAG: gamma-glutamyl-gamma-aminobutyrate hydrolase family protein [Rhodospirillales bacterium]|nr:gamma-glutamyl-gamma-aminobutyrate hydrolase family protein [Rhodospirillales bacterium]
MINSTPPPLIGVAGCRKNIDGQDFDCAGRKYTLAIEQACEAVPLIIPTTGDALDRKSLLARVDGLLFTGSLSNVEPHHYDGEKSQEGTLHDPHRDATTLPLIREAISAGVPVFCICRGFQEINVAYGGSLHQQVHQVPGMLDHREDSRLDLHARYAPVHAIDFNPDGYFNRFTGLKTAQVNSLHGQGINRLADDLLWEAKAPDGIIEAVSVKDSKTFAAAVQWHPEWKVMDNPFYLSLFREFAAACREYMDKRKK